MKRFISSLTFRKACISSSSDPLVSAGSSKLLWMTSLDRGVRAGSSISVLQMRQACLARSQTVTARSKTVSRNSWDDLELARDIDADLTHGPHRAGIDCRWINALAIDLISIAVHGPQESPSHMEAGGVVSAEEQDLPLPFCQTGSGV